ncbi:ABC transporter family protein [Trichomonas vaginalis G3]|uniref:ABC transporter family protein n=1 Tax=Trichomonas vaginalis (strain ATCC PRA-98 / G3) TaxID=412133 RepID=A2FSI1_TRIV3|nr:ATPase activity, coupled to transmembrane movement of substances [Trichomonas vaginalis G3]EAX92131.1 ABC transporter family protein [Trichomonas vaginalis G3]KAI5528922.1 ATPase activity, coupled to transmembrane movement of substances [Trichomonas vaginalis G3]|eukprot:XP_001305061.1 ABC transporter family protein [Trichomonas vaginalis G3]
MNAPSNEEIIDISFGFGAIEDATNISFARIRDPGCVDDGFCFSNISDIFLQMAKDAGIQATKLDFDTYDDLNLYVKNRQKLLHPDPNLLFGYKVYNDSAVITENSVPSGNLSISYFYNTSYNSNMEFQNMIYKAIYIAINPEDTNTNVSINYISDVIYNEDISEGDTLMDVYGTILYPLFWAIGCLIYISFLFTHFIDDLGTPVRPYMITCGLRKSAYWIGNFIIDFIVIIIYSVIIFILYAAFNIKTVKDSFVYLFFTFIASYIVCTIYSYVWAFVFKKKTIASVMFMLIHIVTGCVPFVLYEFKTKLKDSLFRIIIDILCIFPFNNLYNLHYPIWAAIPTMKKPTNITGNKYNCIAIIVLVVSFLLYLFVLWIIELSSKAKKKLAQFGWKGHEEEFKEVKNKQKITQEAIDMEENVKNSSPDDYAIRINDVSKYFTNAMGKPVYAVNQVSLGIKKGSIFGFLGCNGAGKTTLMKIILRQEASSAGSIDVEGSNIDKFYDPTKISICPQFDDHLTRNISGRQNLKFFCYLYGIKGDKAKEIIKELIDILDIEDHVDKKVKNMSGGNQRKCCVALTFLSNANIILVDEPTSSLDPIARHHVHELIEKYKGKKTFMLCTHLLDEAENLCDTISIMLSGCVYTIGTPQYLSNKFGTEWKVDVLLKDAMKETQDAVTDFFTRKIPSAELTIARPLSRIYSIPKDDIDIIKLFDVLEKGTKKDIGIKFYTCSCSTLEKVFMEIVMQSEQRAEEEEDKNENNEASPDQSIPNNEDSSNENEPEQSAKEIKEEILSDRDNSSHKDKKHKKKKDKKHHKDELDNISEDYYSDQ